MLISPNIALYNFAWGIFAQRLARLSPADHAAFAPFLRGARFVRLADPLLNDTPSPLLVKHGIRLDEDLLERVAYLSSLPDAVVTPPEDGDRRAERGMKAPSQAR